MSYIQVNDLKVSQSLHALINNEILPGTHVSSDKFWAGFSRALEELTPKNKALIEKRENIQAQLDQWYLDHKGKKWSMSAYKKFLIKIDYLLPPIDDFKVKTENVDTEIAQIPGPQLIVPVSNPRFALNAANARWGSLFDAYYGTDVIKNSGKTAKGKTFNLERAKEVIRLANDFLDMTIPLKTGKHSQVIGYQLVDNKLRITLEDGNRTSLCDPAQFIAYSGTANKNSSEIDTFLFIHHHLHIELLIDPERPVASQSKASLADVVLESAVTTIQDCEDSVAAVDTEDKINVYRNWLGLMRGDLSLSFEKDGRLITRKLNSARYYTTPHGDELFLRGRSLLLVRNVGHLMTTNAILDADGNEIPEGILDAFVTAASAMHDLNNNSNNCNSREGSIYIVKPKMHGPEEVAFANEIFNHVENTLSLKHNTIKIGVMDEERRTTVNLKHCIKEVYKRLFFINTGFLDRTGDEIHTSMQAGPFMRKDEIKNQAWLKAYENWNVDVGLQCGLPGHAQIGKGMWAKPDEMAEMLNQKIEHPLAGANCAWVPSPTAATLHAIHYHQVDVYRQQREIIERQDADIDEILTLSLTDPKKLTDKQVQDELENNIQGLLGYVVRWINQGIGCSKVPDINHIALMEDRATLRISSQHLANWLLHGLCSAEQIRNTLKTMAKVVDQQNAKDPTYVSMCDDFENSIAFKAASDLIFAGLTQPNGYTEPLLHSYRLIAKDNG